MSHNRWAEIAQLQPNGRGGYEATENGWTMSVSSDGLSQMVKSATVIESYQDALDAVWEAYGGGMCKEHQMVLDEDGWWGIYDYGYPSGWEGDGYPDFFWFGKHANPDADPWCCVELWAHGLPGGGLVVALPEKRP